MSVGHGAHFNPDKHQLPPYTSNGIENGYNDKPQKPGAAKKRTTLADIVNEFGEEFSADAIPRIITRDRWWAKLFWFIISSGLAALFGIQGYGLLLDFFSWPYNTKIDVISKTEVDFPAVTVCNINRMRRSELVGTRYQGIIEIDGGFDLDSDYSWFWDFSSEFYNDWYSDWDWSSYDSGSLWGSSSAESSSTESAVNSTAASTALPTSATGTASTDPPSTTPPLLPGRKKRDPGSGSYSSDSSYYYDSGSYFYDSSYGESGSIPWWEESWYDNFDGFSDFDFDAYESFLFEYDDYYDWNVAGESDWDGFYAQSKTDDYSDIAGIANPTREELEWYGHQAEDLILQCTFDKRGCNHTDFRQFQNNEYGNCYTFNHGFNNESIRGTTKSGAQYGLHLTLFIEQPEYVGIFSPESGVRVSIHDPRIQPSPQDIGITATTGMATSIGIRQSKIERLGGRYTKPRCTADGKDTSYSHDVFSYSSLACKRYCLQTELKERCGCVTDVLIDEEKCSYLNSTQQICKQLTESIYNEEKWTDEFECICPDACSELVYPTSVSSALWPSEKYETHLYNRVAQENDKAARTLQNVESTRKNVVRLRIFFEELNYQLIEQQKAWSIEGISGAVGGLMGLYLGISAVSILEVFIFILKILIYIFSCGHICLNKVHPAS